MHKKILGLIFVLIFASLAYAQEQLTITTYYPSPYGIYKRLQAEDTVIGPTLNSGLNTLVQDSGNLTVFSNNDGVIYLGHITGSGTGYGWRISSSAASGALLFAYANPFLFANPSGSTWSTTTLSLNSNGIGIKTDWPNAYQLFVAGPGGAGTAIAGIDGNLHVNTLNVGNGAGAGYIVADAIYTPFINPSQVYADYINTTVLVAPTKLFEIKHPNKPNMLLRHGSLEGPELAVYYRGEGQLIKGKTKIKLPDYFEALTRKDGKTVILTAKGTEPFLLSYTDIKNGEFMVYGTKPDGQFSWEVKAARADTEPLKVELESKKLTENLNK